MTDLPLTNHYINRATSCAAFGTDYPEADAVWDFHQSAIELVAAGYVTEDQRMAKLMEIYHAQFKPIEHNGCDGRHE